MKSDYASIREAYGDTVVLTDKLIISDQLARIEKLARAQDATLSAIDNKLYEIGELLRYWSMKP